MVTDWDTGECAATGERRYRCSEGMHCHRKAELCGGRQQSSAQPKGSCAARGTRGCTAARERDCGGDKRLRSHRTATRAQPGPGCGTGWGWEARGCQEGIFCPLHGFCNPRRRRRREKGRSCWEEPGGRGQGAGNKAGNKKQGMLSLLLLAFRAAFAFYGAGGAQGAAHKTQPGELNPTLPRGIPSSSQHPEPQTGSFVDGTDP